MIDVSCIQCGAVYHTLEANVGKRILCTRCGHVIAIVLAVTQQAPSRPPISQRAAPSATKKRRGYLVPLVATIGVAVVSLTVFHHSPKHSTPANVRESGTYSTADIAEPESQPTRTQPPEPRPTQYNSLPTGTRIEKDAGTGHGKLTIENGTTEDAVVRLSRVADDQTVRWFFVKAHTTAHMSRIPQGNFRLTYTTGLNWDEPEDIFRWQPSYDEFERTFDYNEQEDSERIRFHDISVTLNPVLFGNVQTKTITRDEFLRGHKHTALSAVGVDDATR